MLKADQRLGQSLGSGKALVDGNGRFLREKANGGTCSLTSLSHSTAFNKDFAMETLHGGPHRPAFPHLESAAWPWASISTV